MNGNVRVAVWGLAGLLAVAGAVAVLGTALRAVGERTILSRLERLESEWGPAPARAPELEPVDNAAYWIEAGALGMWIGDADHRFVRELEATPTDIWTEADRGQLAELISEVQPSIEVMRRAVDIERSSWFDVPTGRDPNAVPWIVAEVRAARLLAQAARLAVDQGRWHAAVERWSILGRMAETIEAHPSRLIVGVGCSIERFLLGTIAEAAPYVDDAAVVEEARASVPSLDPIAAYRAALLADARWTVDQTTARLGLSGGKARSNSAWPRITAWREGAKSVSRSSRMLGLLGRPYAEWSDETRREPGPAEVHRVQATAAQRRLVLAALDLRARALAGADLAGCLDSGDVEPLGGRPLDVQIDDDGSATVAIIDGDQLVPAASRTDSRRLSRISLPPSPRKL